jgi:hypothetical protein
MRHEYRVSKRKSLHSLIISAAWVAFCCWLVWACLTDDRNPSFIGLVSMFGIGFFGNCGLVAYAGFVRTSPMLILDDHGIFDGRSMSSAIPWSEIREIGTRTVRTNAFRKLTFVGLKVSDPARFARRVSRLQKWVRRINKPHSCEDFSIGFRELDTNVEDFF